MRYRIYARYKTQKKFRPMDLRENIQVDSLIRATILDEDQATQFMVKEAPLNAPDWVFELREIK